jgi:hypothetical protein
VPLTDDWIRSKCKQTWVFETAKQWVRMTEEAHGITAAPVQEPDELKHIGEQDSLLDVDESAWHLLVENRGGCRCHISPPCSACSNPISEEEMNEVGYTYTTPPAQPAHVQPVCQKCGGTGQVEEGGVYPSGDLVYVPCECTTPPAAQRQWVGLTPEEIDTVYRDMQPPVQHWQLARAIEAKLKEKNT